MGRLARTPEGVLRDRPVAITPAAGVPRLPNHVPDGSMTTPRRPTPQGHVSRVAAASDAPARTHIREEAESSIRRVSLRNQAGLRVGNSRTSPPSSPRWPSPTTSNSAAGTTARASSRTARPRRSTAGRNDSCRGSAHSPASTGSRADARPCSPSQRYLGARILVAYRCTTASVDESVSNTELRPWGSWGGSPVNASPRRHAGSSRLLALP